MGWTALLSSGLLIVGASGWWIGHHNDQCDIEIAASGHYEGNQLARIRCYVTAEAHHDLSLLRTVTLTYQVHALGDAALNDTQDARAGVPHVRVAQGTVDSTDADIETRYATGPSRTIHMHDDADPDALSSSWKMSLVS